MQDTVVTLTFKQVEHILILGGCPSWPIDPTKAADCKYLICTRNQNLQSTRGLVIGTEPHRSAFLIGKISDVRPTNEQSIPTVERYEHIFADRSNIHISEYALIDIPDLYPGNRQGFAYMSMSDIDLDPDSLVWRRISPPNPILIEAYNRFHTEQRLRLDGQLEV